MSEEGQSSLHYDARPGRSVARKISSSFWVSPPSPGQAQDQPCNAPDARRSGTRPRRSLHARSVPGRALAFCIARQTVRAGHGAGFLPSVRAQPHPSRELPCGSGRYARGRAEGTPRRDPEAALLRRHGVLRLRSQILLLRVSCSCVAPGASAYRPSDRVAPTPYDAIVLCSVAPDSRIALFSHRFLRPGDASA